MSKGEKDIPKLEDWLLAVLPAGARVGVDPSITSMSAVKALKGAFKEAIQVVYLERNLVDEVWGASRPPYSPNPLIVLPESFAGESSVSKMSRIRAKMAAAKAAMLVIGALDEVAWLFNLRGADIPFNPVFRSYALLTADSVTLYMDVSKVTPEIRAHLDAAKVRVAPYESLLPELRIHASSSGLNALDKRVWLDASKISTAVHACFSALGPGTVLEQDNPIQLMKAVKNATEIAGMKNAHIKDAAAVVNFLSWLEIELLENKNTELTECSVADKLEGFRAQQPDFMGLSFETIAGSGPNGAIIHYKAELPTCRKISVSEMFLLDSGAQFKDGTTDITRTVHFGVPTAFERECFTRVLSGHINLASVIFPPNTVGPTLDILARQSLWSAGLEYLHGTGHGVGHFLNVHEGTTSRRKQRRARARCRCCDAWVSPASHSCLCVLCVLAFVFSVRVQAPAASAALARVSRFSLLRCRPAWCCPTVSSARAAKQSATAPVPSERARAHAFAHSSGLCLFRSCLFVFPEPGYYQDGEFGIRVESLVVVSPAVTAHHFGGRQFLCFDTITLVPLQRQLMQLDLLSNQQIEWINAYHKQCRDKVAPLLQGRALEWIIRETEPIVRA